MQLVQFELEIEFEESTKLLTPAHRVYVALGGKELGEKAPAEPAARVRIIDISATIIWNYDKCQISYEGSDDGGQCLQFVDRCLDSISSAAPIGKLESRTVSTCWILPTPSHNFESLEKLYREVLVHKKALMNGAFDSSVIMDINIDQYVLHHQSGAMEPEQLNTDFLEFERQDLPNTFLFLYASILDSEVIQYSKKEMRGYLEKAFSHCTIHSEAFDKIWEGHI